MPLPDDAIVVRGGIGKPETLAMNAATTFDEDGFWAVSACAIADLDLPTIATIAHDVGKLPHPQIRTSTAGRLRGAGFEVVETEGEFPHADILLGGHPPTDGTWVLLASLFDDPIPNPSLPNQPDAQ